MNIPIMFKFELNVESCKIDDLIAGFRKLIPILLYNQTGFTCICN